MAREKLGRLSKYGDPFDSFVAFKNHSPFTCDAQIADRIRQVRDKLSEYLLSILYSFKCAEVFVRPFECRWRSYAVA